MVRRHSFERKRGLGWLSPELPVDSPLASLYYGNLVDTGSPAPAKVFFKAVTAHPGHDEVMADGPFRNHDLENPTASQPSLMDISRYGLDFSTLGSILLRPGRVQVDIANVPAKQYMDVYLSDPASGGADSIIAPGGHGLTDCPPPTSRSGVATMDNGSDSDGAAACEWLSPGDTPWAATAGSITPGDVTHGLEHGRARPSSGRRSSSCSARRGWLPALSRTCLQENSSPFCGSGDFFGAILPLPPVVTSTSTQTTLVVRIRVPKQAQGGEDWDVTAHAQTIRRAVYGPLAIG